MKGDKIQKAKEFAKTATSLPFFQRVEVILELYRNLSAFCHFLETAGCRGSFLYRLYVALVMDTNIWADRMETKMRLSEETIRDVVDSILLRWEGCGTKAGLYAPQYLMAMILDPAMVPPVDHLPNNWLTECDKILGQFYHQDGEQSALDFLAARNELKNCVNKAGSFGAESKMKQNLLENAVGKPPSSDEFGHVAYEIKLMKKLLETDDPAVSWKCDLGNEFPKLKDIAIRLMEMGTQSADVERVCKAHKIVHTKVRNRLTNKNVNLLLHCYVNLRLLKKYEDEGKRVDGRPLDQEDDLEDFLGQALLVNCDLEDGWHHNHHCCHR